MSKETSLEKKIESLNCLIGIADLVFIMGSDIQYANIQADIAILAAEIKAEQSKTPTNS